MNHFGFSHQLSSSGVVAELKTLGYKYWDKLKWNMLRRKIFNIKTSRPFDLSEYSLLKDRKA